MSSSAQRATTRSTSAGRSGGRTPLAPIAANQPAPSGQIPGAQNVNPNITVRASGLDTYIPTIPKVNESDIKAKFKTDSITPIDGDPTFEKMQLAEQELARNALTAKVHFGGGTRGCLGVVYTPTKYIAETGTNWIVPTTKGAYPTFPTNATDDEKKLAISEFIRDEHGIKVVEAVQELLKNQFIEAIDEDYILELKQGIQEWNGRSLLDLLTHVRTNYATMDDLVYNDIMKRFSEPPDMDLPIDKYFTKQDECYLLASDSDNPITDAAMVLQLTTHMAATGMINRSVTKFKRQAKPERTWKKGKIWFRRDLKAISDEAKAAGVEMGYQANMIKAPSARDTARDEAREEIADGMKESFGMLAQAAVAKSDTIDAHAATIASQAKAIAELTATNAILVAALAAAKNKQPKATTPPPGFAANATGHTLNTAGIACPTRTSKAGNVVFVTSQDCNICGKNQYHIPANCLEAPQNAALKVKMAAKWAAEKALKEAQAAATK